MESRAVGACTRPYGDTRINAVTKVDRICTENPYNHSNRPLEPVVLKRVIRENVTTFDNADLVHTGRTGYWEKRRMGTERCLWKLDLRLTRCFSVWLLLRKTAALSRDQDVLILQMSPLLARQYQSPTPSDAAAAGSTVHQITKIKVLRKMRICIKKVAAVRTCRGYELVWQYQLWAAQRFLLKVLLLIVCITYR